MKYHHKPAEREWPHGVTSCHVETLTEIPETAADREYLHARYPHIPFGQSVSSAALPKIVPPDWQSIAMMQAYDRRLAEAVEWNKKNMEGK